MKKDQKPQEETPKEDLNEQSREYLDQLQRLQAEFMNFRHRVEKEKDALKQTTANKTILKFLEVKDNFDRAPKLDKGMEMIYNQFLKIFEEEQVKETEYETFNPAFHEAIATDPTKDKDTIVEVVEKGYLRNNIVMRPAKVVVGTKENKNE